MKELYRGFLIESYEAEGYQEKLYKISTPYDEFGVNKQIKSDIQSMSEAKDIIDFRSNDLLVSSTKMMYRKKKRLLDSLKIEVQDLEEKLKWANVYETIS